MTIARGGLIVEQTALRGKIKTRKNGLVQISEPEIALIYVLWVWFLNIGN